MNPLFDAAAPLAPGRHLITGGPGTGKTHLAAQLVARLHADGVPLDALLVVAPRRSAAHQLHGAIAAALPEAPLDRLAIVAPMALAERLAAELGPAIGLDAPGRVLGRPERGDAEHVVADFWSRVVARAPADRVRALDRLKPEALVALAMAADADPTCAWLPQGGDSAPDNLKRALAEHARTAVAAERAARGVALPTDVFTAFARALDDAARAEALQAAARHRYAGVIVDDAADLAPPVLHTLAHLLGRAGHTWLLADPEQVIGLPPTGRRRWFELAAQTPAQRLGVAHRASPRLAQGLARLWDRGRLGPEAPAPAWPRDDDPEAHDAAGDGLVVRWLAPAPAGREPVEWVAERVADDVGAWLAAGHALDSAAVLVSRHAEGEAVAHALRGRGIAVARFGGESVYAGPVAADLGLLFRAVVERSPGVIRAALATELGGLDAPGVAALLDDEVAWTTWSDRVRGWWLRWNEAGVLPMVQAMRADLGLEARWLRRADGARRLADLRDLAERLHRQAAEERLDPTALLAVFEEARATARAGEASPRLADDAPAVAVRTIHAARGRAWPAVFVPFGWRPPWVGPWPRAVGPEGPAADVRGAKGDPGLRRAAEAEALARQIRGLRAAVGRAERHAALYWGPLPKAGTSPLAAVLFPQPEWPDRVSRHVDAHGPDALRAEVAAIAPEHLVVRDAGDEHQTAAPLSAPPPMTVLPWGRTTPLDRAWRRTSFSGLTRDAHHAGQGGADEVEDETLTQGLADDARPVPLIDVPAGAVVGTCLHAIFEEWDFQQADALPAAVATGLETHGLDATLAADITPALQAAAEVPLFVGGPRLVDLARSCRLDELDFVFPLTAAVEPADLAADLRAWPGDDLPADYAEHLAALPTAAVRGFISGSIDLVFRWQGRWYLVDYKSNRLGDTFADYGRRRLNRAMVESHYLLQAHLYAVALHRFLRWRLGADYVPERDFGGVGYLFLRGMHPDFGDRRGVWFARPPVGRIEALSARFGEAT